MRGTCKEFCPRKEVKWRIKEKLLHFFEYRDGQKNVPGILVKSFARSAAGSEAPSPEDLRTEECLRRTVKYLLENIVVDTRKPFYVVYDFIFDRLRAVRQETIIQNFDCRQSVLILEPIVLFLAYSRYRLCEEHVDNFAPKICEQHLLECLKRILLAYDELECSELPCKAQYENRIFIEALYQVYNLGSVDAFSRCLYLPNEVKSSKLFSAVFSISLNYHQGNVFRVIRGICSLPHVLCAIGSLKIQTLRRKTYEIFSHAYNNKQLCVPLEFVSRVVHQKKSDIINDCKYYNLRVSEDLQSIYFVKSDFNATLPALKSKHESFVDVKFEKLLLPDILLTKRPN